MKLKRNYKKCLSTAILLCLMASSAYAMPTGGNVVMGNVTNVNNPAAIMAANAHSIIDWNKFNIAANEKVTFNTNTFTVLNRVQGGYESQILGVLQDQGKGHLILMNPSGIVLGENAVIDAHKLTLTTLEIRNDEFNNLVNGKNTNFETKQPKYIDVKNNAKITVKEALNLYGGKISIADGVEIVSKEYGKVGVNMFATAHVKVGSNSANEVWYYENGSVSIGDAQIGNDDAAVANLDVRAENTKINGADIVADNQSNHKKKVILLSGSEIEVNNATIENRNGDIDIVASDGWKAVVTWDTFTAYPSETNKATVKNTSFKTSDTDVAILGANVDVYGSNIISGKNLIVGAVKEYSNVEGITTATTYDTSTVNVDDNTQVDVAGTSTVYGAIVNVDWKKFDQTVATTNPLVMWQGRNDISNEEIIEQAKNLKDKKEMQRIINMLQDAGGTVGVPSLPNDNLIVKDGNDTVTIGGKSYQEIIDEIHKIDNNQEPYWKQKIEAQKINIPIKAADEVQKNNLKNFENTKQNNASLIYNGKTYFSDTGEAYSGVGGHWIKTSEKRLVGELKFNLLGGVTGLIASNKPDVPDELNPSADKMTGLDVVTTGLSWFGAFADGAFDKMILKVETHELGNENKLVIKTCGDTNLHQYVGKEMRSETMVLYISEDYVKDPYDYYVEFDKDLNASLVPRLPANSYAMVKNKEGAWVPYKFASKKLTKEASTEILGLLEKNGFHFGEYNSLREQVIDDVKESGGVPSINKIVQRVTR